jgi:DMSO/TMAO reductase YedYZ molybdopterin-dependent catalytic subunit
MTPDRQQQRRRDQDRRRRTNLALAGLLPAAVLSGVGANLVGTDWPVDLIAVHAVLAVAILVLSPWKSLVVRSGWRRPRPDGGPAGRLWSVLLSLLVLAALLSGLAHATGLVDRLAALTVMQLHVGAGLLALLALAAHLRRHPVRAKAVDRGRRALLGAGGVLAASTVLWAGSQRALAVAGAPGASRRFTGSVQHGSGRPALLPVVSWIDDRTPSADPQRWRISLPGRSLTGAELAALPQQRVSAVLDCTGGWYSRQQWTGVRLDQLLGPLPAGTRSVEVVSATGFTRRFPVSDLGRIWLASGLGDHPLPPGHGFPARIVAPGRRGFWWVKWVVELRASPRPWWLQSPFPTT